jgi:monoamine oxidase
LAIVGAGIAGLNAALTLRDKGIGSTVYEASDRIGGRMHSDRSGYWANAQVSEFCGELIDTNHTVILGWPPVSVSRSSTCWQRSRPDRR